MELALGSCRQKVKKEGEMEKITKHVEGRDEFWIQG